MKKYIAEHNINFYIINATKIATEIGLGNRINTIMQSAFFKITQVIPFDLAVKEMKDFIVKSFSRKGEEIVNMNHAAVDKGAAHIHKVEVPRDWAELVEEKQQKAEDNGKSEFIKSVVDPINALKGDSLPVSAFKGREDGTFPQGTTEFEKRGIAVSVPRWIHENCIQCNQCAYVCPHSCIRPFLLTDQEKKAAPEGTETIKGKGAIKEFHFRIQVSPLDCTGCGNCVEICPSKEKSLVLEPLGTQEQEHQRWQYMHKEVGYKQNVVDIKKTVKNSQFAQPLFEFSGACGGCGETPYVKLITQLFGDRMMIANATGCSSIYGGSAPSTPYTVNEKGHGPTWANSLFEDNAEYGYGMALGVNAMRDRIQNRMEKAMENGADEKVKEAFTNWIQLKNNGDETRKASDKVMEALKNVDAPWAKEIKDLKDYLVKKSVWMLGGDGWAYDIGFGGLDHVLASGEDVNALVMDTEVYSNTGGQASKATPVGAVAKFAASGMKTRKKDLGRMIMTYGYVYVAQVAMGASQNQLLKAMREAEEYPGPSLVIAYSPCINHGLKKGMAKMNEEQKLAVEAGYWQLYRYNPLLEKEGKNPFQLDSKEPDWDKFDDFIASEIRYSSLTKSFPQEADRLFKIAKEDAIWRYNAYKRMTDTPQ